MEIKVLRNIMSANDAIAGKNQALLDKHKILALNIMSSPGAGKTSLILNTIDRLGAELRMAVIEGDVASRIDAEKVRQKGVAAIQINVGSSCCLEAQMVSSALEALLLSQLDLLIIENVGNLICPAEFALGEHRKVVISSLPEGDDKPAKYPLIFTDADAVVINKLDLAPYVDFNLAGFQEVVRGLNPDVKFFLVSCRTGSGLDEWCAWIVSERKRQLARR